MEKDNEQGIEYRLSFIVKDEDASAVRAELSAHGAEIIKEQALVKIRLAYPIAKQQFGFAGAFVFRSSPESFLETLTSLKRDGKVLRAMVIKDFPREEEEGKLSASGTLRPRPLRRVGKERPVRTQLSNEALEKKIEEILQ